MNLLFSSEWVNDAEKIRITYGVKCIWKILKSLFAFAKYFWTLERERQAIRLVWKIFMCDKKVRDTLKCPSKKIILIFKCVFYFRGWETCFWKTKYLLLILKTFMECYLKVFILKNLSLPPPDFFLTFQTPLTLSRVTASHCPTYYSRKKIIICGKKKFILEVPLTLLVCPLLSYFFQRYLSKIVKQVNSA